MNSDQLEQRLRTGEQRIEAERNPEKREQMISFWIELLHEYEAAVDRERAEHERRAA